MTLRVTRLDTRRLGFGTDDAMLIVERQEKILNILRRRRTALLGTPAEEIVHTQARLLQGTPGTI